MSIIDCIELICKRGISFDKLIGNGNMNQLTKKTFKGVMFKNGAKIIASALKDLGVKRVFLFPGGTIAPLIDELVQVGIEYICMRHEQGAGFAAIGAAKETNFPQVVIVSSGPGATNLVTCIADAFYDSVPILALTGQVQTDDLNIDKNVRQTGFQETDVVGIMRSISKEASILKETDNLYQKVWQSFQLTLSGRKGPVLIDMPMNIQKKEFEIGSPEIKKIEKPVKNLAQCRDIDEKKSILENLIYKSKRPLILAGNGIYLANAVKEFRKFARKINLPIVLSLPAMGCIKKSDRNYVGMIGHTGEFYANLSLFHCDLLICLGARLDLRQTGTELESFLANKSVVRVDVDEKELIHGRVSGDLNFNLGLSDFFKSVEIEKFGEKAQAGWREKIQKWRQEYDSLQFYSSSKLTAPKIIRYFSDLTNGLTVSVSTGVGTHQQLSARYFDFDYPTRTWQTSSGHGTMGYDLPSITGAMIAGKADLGICFVGDGSFQLNIQELATIREYNLNIVVVVLNNRRLGIVSQFQLMNWETDHSTGGKENPDFARIGEAYGLQSMQVKDIEELKRINIDALQSENLPLLVECFIDEKEDVLPMLMGGQKLNQMHPYNNEVSFKE